MYRLSDVEKAKEEFLTKFAEYEKTNNIDNLLTRFSSEGDQDRLRGVIVDGVKNFAIASLPVLEPVRFGTGELGLEKDEGEEVYLPYPHATIIISINVDTAGKITSVTLSLSTRGKEGVDVKVRSNIPLVSLSTKSVYEFFRKAYLMILERTMESTNLRVVNTQMGRILESANVPFKIVFTADNNSRGRFIKKITKDEIVYSVTKELLFAEDEATLVADYSRKPFSNTDTLTRRKLIRRFLNNEKNSIMSYTSTVEYAFSKPSFVSRFVKQSYFHVDKVILHSAPYTLKALKMDLKESIVRSQLALYRVEGEGYAGIVSALGGEVSVWLEPFDPRTGEFVDVDLVGEALRLAQ